MIDAVAAYGLSTSKSSSQNRDALHTAIAAAAGNTLFVPDGIYATDPVTIDTDHTTLQLAPGAVLQVAPTATSPSLLEIRASHVTIDGGQFEGNSIGHANSYMAIRIYGSRSHIKIRNCTLRNVSTGLGAYNAVDCEDWLIEGNTIDTTVSSHAIYLHGHPTKNTNGVKGVRVLNNTILGAKENGIWVGNYFSDVTITGNRISDVGRMGIEVWKNPGGHFVIANNIIDTCRSFGISIAGVPHTICHSNIISNATTYGIEVANSRFVTLANNHINGVRPHDSGAGIKPTGISLNLQEGKELGDICIQGGIITGCIAGINVSGDGETRGSIAITGVIIRDCSSGIRNAGNIGGKDGGGTVRNLVVTGCNINVLWIGIGNSPNGGKMEGGVISGNNIVVTNGPGIDLFRPANMLVTGNRICGAGLPASFGIRLHDNLAGNSKAHNLRVANNSIAGFGTLIKVQHIYDSLIA